MSLRRDPVVRTRKEAAGRFGFTLGCVAALIAAAVNLSRAPRPWTVPIVLLAVLLAALNIPLGIGFALLGERLTRPRDGRPR